MIREFLGRLPPIPDKTIFEVGKIYRYIGGQYTLPLFRTKEASGSYPHTSRYEEVGDLHKNEPFLVIAVEPFVLDDYDDEGNPFWDDEHIKIMSATKLGWLSIDMRYQTPRNFEEMTEETAQKELELIKERETKTLGGLGRFEELVPKKVP